MCTRGWFESLSNVSFAVNCPWSVDNNETNQAMHQPGSSDCNFKIHTYAIHYTVFESFKLLILNIKRISDETYLRTTVLYSVFWNALRVGWFFFSNLWLSDCPLALRHFKVSTVVCRRYNNAKRRYVYNTCVRTIVVESVRKFSDEQWATLFLARVRQWNFRFPVKTPTKATMVSRKSRATSHRPYNKSTLRAIRGFDGGRMGVGVYLFGRA